MDMAACEFCDRAFVSDMAQIRHVGTVHMDAAALNDADKTFLNDMLAHHQAALKMADVVLEDGKDPRVKKLAKQIIKVQYAEIQTMKKLGAKDSGGSAHH